MTSLVTRASAENDAAANAVAIVTPSDARRAHLQLELGNIAVSSYDALEAVPLRLGSFPRATMAAEIRYREMRECGRRCLEHQQRDNGVGWGATDGNAK